MVRAEVQGVARVERVGRAGSSGIREVARTCEVDESVETSLHCRLAPILGAGGGGGWVGRYGVGL